MFRLTVCKGYEIGLKNMYYNNQDYNKSDLENEIQDLMEFVKGNAVKIDEYSEYLKHLFLAGSCEN